MFVSFNINVWEKDGTTFRAVKNLENFLQIDRMVGQSIFWLLVGEIIGLRIYKSSISKTKKYTFTKIFVRT